MSWKYVRPDENWIRNMYGVSPTGLFASSEQTGYEVENVADDDPASPWWASSGTANFSVNLGSGLEVGILALIMNNGDNAKSISVTGDVTTSIVAARQANLYPKNVAHIPVAPFTGQNFTFSISANSLNWAVGEVVIGKLREWPESLLINPLPRFGRKRQVITDIDDDHEHEYRTDLGSETWAVTGRIFRDDSDFEDVLEWWETTNGGTIPTLIVPDDHDQQPRLVRMPASFEQERMKTDRNWIDITFVECSRGILVQ